MPRSPIRNQNKDVITDDGSVLISVAKGEQIHITFTATSETDLTGYTLTAKVAEGANQPGDLTEVPFQEDSDTPTITTLPIIDADASDNTFIVVIPDDLCDTWAVQPTPDDPVYGFFSLQVEDTGTGDAQQIRVPVRGLIEVRYNPVESS